MAIRLAALVSGGGTTLQNLLDRIADGRLNASIEIVVSTNPQAKAIDRARAAGVPVTCVSPRGKDVATFSQVIFDHCREAHVDLVVLGGFLRLLVIPDDFHGRVMNIHPALIPSFCGKGYYGLKVHQAAIEYGVKLSGCTVHFCDNEYDHGPIVLQRAVPVLEDDTPARLAERIFQVECEALPEAIRLFAAGRLRIAGRRVLID